MAFKTSPTDVVINNRAELLHKSFAQLTGTIQSTENKITAYDGAASDFFGYSVAAGSSRIVIGAYGDDDISGDSGAVYIYDLDGNLITKLTAFDGAFGDNFSINLAVGSGRIVVGAYRDDDNGSNSGSAYVYDLNGNLITKLTAYDGAVDDYFGGFQGSSISVGSGRIVVGAYQDDDNGSQSGSAYVYDLDGNLITKLTAYDGAVDDRYGFSVAAGSGRIVISAPYDNSTAGSAYVYDLDGNLITKLTAFDGFSGAVFGRAVAVGSSRIVVSSSNDNDKGTSSGSAYVYDLDGNLITKLTAFDGATSDLFGYSVAVRSGRIVVGAYQDDDNGSNSGSAYVYDLEGNLITKLTASDGADNDRYGWSVAVGSGRIVIGAFRDEDNGTSSGSAYIYELDQTYDTYIESILGH